jgi:uncharacterized damage-inducible protein DinB
MAKDVQPEFWLSGPVDGIIPLLQPVAHALLQARREVQEAMDAFDSGDLWSRPAGVASVGFHLQHLRGVLDRLFTYARGSQLTPEQLQFLKSEGQPVEDVQPASLVQDFHRQVETALIQLRETKEDSLLDTRYVGRKRIPSNVLGLLFHAAEHTQRHTGQLIVTARILMNEDKD